MGDMFSKLCNCTIQRNPFYVAHVLIQLSALCEALKCSSGCAEC